LNSYVHNYQFSHVSPFNCPFRPKPSVVRMGPTPTTEDLHAASAAGCRPGACIPPAPRRRRPALSCFPCRNRKLRCDRKIPTCTRCLQAGPSSECAYRDDILHHVAKSKKATKQPTPTNLIPDLSTPASLYRPRSEVDFIQANTGTQTWFSACQNLPRQLESYGNALPKAILQDADSPPGNGTSDILGTIFL